MKKLLLALFLFINYFSHSQITIIPDPNFEQALIDLGHDTSLNGWVLTGSIDNITSLNIASENISDLTGIQNFSNLETLIAYGNNLTTVNLSSNTQLQSVRLNNNQLTSITLGNLPNLTYMQLHVNEINSIDLSGLPILELVHIRDNNLSSIDVSNNTLLEEVSIQENNLALTSLDFSNNPNFEYLYCSDNPNLNTLNIANNNQLKLLWCSNTQIGTLDLRHTSLLAELQCENSQLTYLNVKNGGNTLMNSNFDFRSSGNPNLTCIQVDDATYSTNTWTIIDNTSSFGEHCYDTYVPDDNFEQALIDLGYDSGSLDDYLPEGVAETITTLNIFNKGIVDVTGLEAMTNLNILSCPNNNIVNLDISSNTNLTALWCSNNPLMTLNVSNNVMLTDLIVTSIPTLTALDLSANTALSYLEASFNGLNSIDLANNTLLTGLIAKSNNLTSLNLTQNTLLETLKIDSNPITNINTSANTALRVLTLESTQITTIDLSTNTVLKELTCSNNVISSLDLTANNQLTKILAENCQLTQLDIKNGNNTAISNTNFKAGGNPNLNCINVDDETWSTNNWTFIDGTSAFGIHCYETYVPDDNFETYLETHDASGNSVAIGNTNSMGNGIANDDYVLTERINTVETLNIPTLGITDITGIADFIALTSFDCSANSITTMDLSSNTSLQFINASSSNITSINITGLTALAIVNLNDNLLTTIDVSTNTAMIWLLLKGNDITTLDFTTNIALALLDVSNNELIALNVKNSNNTLMNNSSDFKATGNPNLTCINVDDEAYSTTTWTNINEQTTFSEDCSATTNVPDDNFENYLETHDTSGNIVTLGDPLSMGNGVANDNYVLTSRIKTVTTLSVIFKSISDLTGIEDFTALEELNCQFNNLTSLDVSNNLALATLTAFTNDITALDLSNNVNLVSIQVLTNDLTTLNIANGNNSNITTFNAQNNASLTCINVDDASANYLSSWTKDAGASFSEHCNDTFVPDNSFENYLETHDADGNVVSIGDALSMGNGIANDDYVTTAKIDIVTELNVSNLGIASLSGIEGFVELRDLQASNNTLTTIDLSGNAQLRILRANSNAITAIDFSNNPLLGTLELIANDLTMLDFSSNPVIRIIDVGNNNLTTLSGLENNTTLFLVIAEDNLLTSLDFSTNINVRVFRLNNNNLTALNVKNGTNTIITQFRVQNNPNLTCVLVDDATYSNSNTIWDNKDSQTTYSDTDCNAKLSPIVFLQGAALNPNTGEENLMRDDLRVAGLIPTISPYGDGVTCNASLFNATGNNAIVDWINIELRDPNDATIVVETKSALLTRSGLIVDTNGTSGLAFNAWANRYYVVIKHRNHLGIMTNTAETLDFVLTPMDFSNGSITTYGTDAQTSFGMPINVVAMWAGDATTDGLLNYLGASSDIPSIRSQVFNDPNNSVFGGPPVGTYQSVGYTNTDVDMNGVTVYSGAATDVLYIRNNIFNNPSNSVFGGPPVGTYVFVEQLPN